MKTLWDKEKMLFSRGKGENVGKTNMGILFYKYHFLQMADYSKFKK